MKFDRFSEPQRLSYGTRRFFNSEKVSDEVLTGRVPARRRNFVSHPGAIEAVGTETERGDRMSSRRTQTGKWGHLHLHLPFWAIG